MKLPRTILVPTDFSPQADAALEYAAGLGARLDATIHLVHAVPVPIMGVPEIGVAYVSLNIESITKQAQTALDDRAKTYREQVSMAPVRLETGDARDVIDRVAETIGADLIIMGTHGRRGIRRALLGSVAESVVRSAPCPVLAVRERRTS
jgi:nucleotide-binding universal stress UspA family protein